MQSSVGPSSGGGVPPPGRGPPPPPGHGGGPGGPDDGDNRSRNAKAQRRHREKRKAHFKALEESVQVLTAQLEEARRQLANAAYASSSRMVYSPDANKDVAQLANEVAYLREENNDLRRQLYALRYARGESTSSGMVPPSSAGDPQGKVTTGIWPEVKQEGAYVYSTPVVSSPRVASSHGRTMSHPGDFVRSPYVPSAPFPGADPRTAYPPVRYESAVYPAPPPHSLPRSAVGSSGSSGSANYQQQQVYVPQHAEGEVAWSQDQPQTQQSTMTQPRYFDPQQQPPTQ
ncbi:hypothetical protein A1Q2_01077 [Trichosporon asahii var. asahii CBS 8904]|uniref:BZIP domain-containing protein n=2 Tax=Trichosporon asahii var. asahii TaxID=189963 RepID=K1VYL2_TRIAC|nr:hypothetical protein A1Q1_07584 [Trichosporon asahii var. asahii CBS 2479]EJT51227.1 hypothetical protein A1Q1_07584 [Trichosporon asahii var. asahii CBS 2479]EKD04617.1 hypothetical protein A1Q2_01077 [Trichosporon asahii var. asahii CBS 8904]